MKAIVSSLIAHMSMARVSEWAGVDKDRDVTVHKRRVSHVDTGSTQVNDASNDTKLTTSGVTKKTKLRYVDHGTLS